MAFSSSQAPFLRPLYHGLPEALPYPLRVMRYWTSHQASSIATPDTTLEHPMLLGEPGCGDTELVSLEHRFEALLDCPVCRIRSYFTPVRT